MKTLTTVKAWILICSIISVSSATEHPSSQHDLSHHGDSTPKKNLQNTIVPFGIQIPEHVLSTQDVACISADSNIFEIMNKAQDYCNGTDMRCTFYHFVNHGYKNIGTLDIDKELFDDLLMKFDNWLLTAENNEKNYEPLDRKTKEDTFLDTASINVNGSYSNEEQIENSTNVSETEDVHNMVNVDHNTNDSDDDKIVNTHHIKNLYDTHHRNHHYKSKNGNHIKLVPEYNNKHKYFEVFLSKDKETGKPRTIYVEVDKDKNRFVLLDEEIDKKLNGIKPIKIELDELSEIADTTFNNKAESSNHKEHIYNSNDDDRIMSSDLNTYSAIYEDTTNLDKDVRGPTQNILNPSICNINTNQELIPDNTTGNVKKTLNVSKNLVLPNKYINQASFHVESQLYNKTDEIPNYHLEILESSSNETDMTGFDEEAPLHTIEFNENNTNIDLDLDNIEYSPENFDILRDNNSLENYKLSTEHDNVTFYDDYFIQLEENNDTSIDIDFDDTHDFSTFETTHLNEPISQTEKHVQENKPKSTPTIYTEPKLTPSPTTGMSDYDSSQLDAIPSENRQGFLDQKEHSPGPGIPLSSYTNVPIMGKDLAKVVETDDHLQLSFPVYATLDLSAGASQKTPLDSDFEHPCISTYNSPLDSGFGQQTTGPEIFQHTSPIFPTPRIESAAPNFQYTSPVFPSPPVECIVRLNKGSKYSPLNFGFSWLPSFSRIEDLRLPYTVNASPQESILQLSAQKNKQLTDSICPEPSSLDHTIPAEDPRLFHTVPPLSVDGQKPSLTTVPYHLEANVPMPSKHVLPSTLDLPKSVTDSGRISTTYELSETPLSVKPYRLQESVNSPCPMQQIEPFLQPTKPNLMDFGLIKYSPCDNKSNETMIPCTTNRNRYPYTSTPCFANPFLRPPQIITPYSEPLLPVTPLQPTSKISTLDSLPTSSDESYPYLNGDYRQEINQPTSLLPNSPCSSVFLGPGFVSNTLPYQNLWNKIPKLPCSILPDQNIRNYPPIVSNYVTPSAVFHQNQILKPLLSKSVPLSALEQPCPFKNVLEKTPVSYTPFLTPVQMDSNPSLALERDLQSLSLKYGIPLSKILNSLETEISDVHSKTTGPICELPYSNLVHNSSPTSKPTSTKTNAAFDDENKSYYREPLLESELSNLVPLDSALIGPHLELESSLILKSNDSQSHTVLSETTFSHSSFENQPTKAIQDSSLIGPHLTTLSTSNFVLSDENRTANEAILSESDISNSILLDSSLIGPHLEIGSPPIVLDSNYSHSDILASQTEEPITVSSQNKQKIYLNQPTNFLDSSLIGSHLPSLSPVRPLLSNEIQNINDMMPLETDLTDLTPLDSSVIGTQEGLVNQLELTGILQHKERGVTLSGANASPDVHKPLECLPTNLVQELVLESDSSRLIPLDSSLIGPELKLGSSLIITDSLEDKTVPLISKDSILKTDIKVDELENIMLPPSLLPTLLKKTVKANSNLNINTQDTKLNEKLDELAVDTNVEFKDISFKKTSFKILESIPELPSFINESKPLLTKDSKTFKHISKPSDITHVVDSETILDSSLTGTSKLHKLETPEVSASLDSLIHLDSSLIGSSILQEIDSREILPILDSESSLAPTTLNQNKKPSEILTVTDSAIELQSSFKDLDSSLEGSHLLTVPFSSDEIQIINKELQSKSDLANLVPLDSSLIGPHVDFESELEQSEITRYQKPESFLTTANPEVSETTEFLSSDLVKGVSPLEPITVPSICASDLQELLSKFTNAITKAQLSPSELKPCDKLLSSIAKISSDNFVLPSCKDLQTLTLNTLLNTPLSLQDELASEFSPITLTYPAQEFSPVESMANGLGSNYFPTPITMIKSRPYTQGVPQIPITPYAQFVQMNPLTDRNWLGPNNMQNILQTSPSFRPVPGNTPAPFNSNLLPVTSEDLKSLLDLASYSKIYPQLSIPNMYTPGDAIAPSSEWNKSSNIVPLDKYIPILLKRNSSVLPLESTIANSEYNPIKVDDIMPLINENSLQLLKDMSILPFSESALRPTNPVFEKGEIVSPSLLETVPILGSDFIQTGPSLPVPITNPLVPSSTYNPKIRLNNLQNLPYIKQTPNIISPCNLQPHSNTPLHSQFSEIIGPAPNFVTLPTESSKALLQQLLSKPCLKSPIIPPSSSLDTLLQLPTTSNELNSVPSKLPPEYFTPISPMYKTLFSNALTSPIIPIYVSQSSVSFAKPISPPSTSIPLNIPYVDSPLTLIPLSISPCTAKPLTPKYPSPVMPLKRTPISDYPHPPTLPHNRLIPSEIPYTPSHTYSSPYLPVHPCPIPTDTSPGSPKTMNKLPAAITSPISPVFYEPQLTPYVSPVPKSLTNLELPAYSSPLTPIFLSKLAPTSTSLLSTAHLSPTNSYPSLPAPMNTQARPSNVLTPASITPISPVSSSLSSSNTPLLLNPKIITPEIKSRQLNILPISNAVNPLLNANQWLQINSNIPLQSYPIDVSKPLPSSFSNSQIKQYIPNEHALESNLLTSQLTEDIPSYDVIKESAYTYSNDKDEKYYAEPSLKYPLESLSYTLAPEEIAETLPPEDFIKLEDFTPSATVNNCATEPSLQTKSYQDHLLTPYTPVQGKPLSKPRPVPQLLPLPPIIETIPQSICDSVPLVPSSDPLKYPVSLPTSILSSPLLKPLTPLTSALNFPITSVLLPGPRIDSLYNKLPMNEKLQSLSSSPYYSTPSQDKSLPHIYPTGIRNILSPQETPGFSQVPTNTPFVPVSSPMDLPKSQPLTSPYILDNYIQLPSTHYEPKSKTLTSQGSLVEPLPTPSNTQLAAPITSYISPLEMPISSQYITPLSPPQNLKVKPLLSPQYMSSILPAQRTLQDSLLLKEAPTHYQQYTPQTTTLTSSAKSIFKSSPVTSPYTALQSVNIVEPIITDLNRLSSNSTPQHSLPSLLLPVSKYSPIISYSNHPLRISPHISKQVLTNQIIPSSLFMSSDTGLQTPTNKLTSAYNIPRYSSPSPFLTDPLETVPYYAPLDTTANQQNILKPMSSLSNIQYPDHLSSQPLQPTDCYQTKPVSNVEFTTKPHPNLSPVPAQYASPYSEPIYTSLPLETVPYRQINKFGAPQYSLPSALIYDSPIHSSSLTRNPFLNPDFKPITEVPPYPVPKNIISSSKLTPSESILLSNLRPLDISQDPFESYSPFTSVPTLPSSYLLKPLAKRLPQKSRQYQPHKIPSNSQYVSQLPIESVPELLQSTCPLLKSSLLKPLSKNFQINAPLIPMRFSNTNTALSEDFPLKAVPSVTSPDIALSNYLPSDSSNHKYSGPYDSLASKIPETVTPINPSSTTPNSFLKSAFNKHFKSPLSSLANIPLYSNYGILDPSPNLPVRANIVSTARPVEVSATSALESSPLFLDSLDTETIEKTEPYELMPDLKDRFPPLPIGFNQHRELHPASTSKYLATPQPTKTLPSSKYKTSRPRPSFFIPSLIPEDAELIDTTDFSSLSQIMSEPLIADYTPSDTNATKPNTPSNMAEPDILQFFPYTTLLNTNFPSPTYKELPPKLQTPRYSNQILQPSPIYLSPQEYKDLIQGPSPSQVSSSSPTILSPTNTEPQLVTNPLTGRPRPQIPFYNPISITSENWLQSPTFAKSLPLHENLTEVTPENISIQTLLNKYRPANNIPLGNNYPYEPKSIIPEVPLEFDSIKPVNPLLKSKEPYTELIEDSKSNEDNYNEPDLDNICLDEQQPNSFESKLFTKTLPVIIKGLGIPNYNYKAQRLQKLSKLDNFYANNHIGKGSQVYTVPTYNTLPFSSPTGVKRSSSAVSPEILKDFTDIPTKHFGSVPQLETISLPSEYNLEITDSPENIPITNLYPQNYLNPYSKYTSQMKSPDKAIEIADTFEMTPISNTPYNNIDDIKYSGYKTYQIPSFESPQMPHNLGTPTQIYSPSVVPYFTPIPAVKPLKIHQTPSLPNFYSPTETEPLIPQYQTLTKMAIPLQTKLGVGSLQESPELNEYNPIEDIPISVDNINEDNELKTSLINYINKRQDVKNNLINKDAEITIPIGNIALTRNEPYNANTIETNNPSIGLKVWKSNVKIAKAELKLKFKDLSVNNFMPIVNNLDKYDMEEIRRIVKRYIDEKYGNHIEINEPYIIGNRYTIIKDFDHNAVDDKYNLLWPTNYV